MMSGIGIGTRCRYWSWPKVSVSLVSVNSGIGLTLVVGLLKTMWVIFVKFLEGGSKRSVVNKYSRLRITSDLRQETSD